MGKIIFPKNRFAQTNILIMYIYLVWNWMIIPTCFASQGEITDKIENPKTAVSIRVATPNEEFSILLNTLGNMAFFRKHGYDVTLPDNEDFNQLAESSVDISEVDKNRLYKLFAGEIYDTSHYERGLERLRHAEQIVGNAFPIFEKFNEKWGFTVHKSYDVILTLYGPGGQYHPQTGKIFLKTTVNGQFERIDPTHTIIHEMVHIGIDKTIVKEYKLTHWEKERVVDLICSFTFSDILDKYTIQPKGEKGLDEFVNKDSIMNLPLAIKSYVRQKNNLKKGSIEIIVVDKVFKGSQAENIGIQEGDILIEYDGERITSPEKLVEVVKSKAKKKKIELVIIRGTHIERFVISGGSIGIKIAKDEMLKVSLPKEYQ